MVQFIPKLSNLINYYTFKNVMNSYVPTKYSIGFYLEFWIQIFGKF